MEDRGKHVAKRPWAELASLTTAELKQKWLEIYGGDKAPKLKRELLLGALTYAIQGEVHGGLKVRTCRILRQLAANPEELSGKIPALAPGTRLVREWQGRTHVVEAGEDGFFWQGEKYASLSAIARKIAGTRWSGPRFFGLNSTTAARSS